MQKKLQKISKAIRRIQKNLDHGISYVSEQATQKSAPLTQSVRRLLKISREEPASEWKYHPRESRLSVPEPEIASPPNSIEWCPVEIVRAPHRIYEGRFTGNLRVHRVEEVPEVETESASDLSGTVGQERLEETPKVREDQDDAGHTMDFGRLLGPEDSISALEAELALSDVGDYGKGKSREYVPYLSYRSTASRTPKIETECHKNGNSQVSEDGSTASETQIMEMKEAKLEHFIPPRLDTEIIQKRTLSQMVPRRNFDLDKSCMKLNSGKSPETLRIQNTRSEENKPVHVASRPQKRTLSHLVPHRNFEIDDALKQINRHDPTAIEGAKGPFGNTVTKCSDPLRLKNYIHYTSHLNQLDGLVDDRIRPDQLAQEQGRQQSIAAYGHIDTEKYDATGLKNSRSMPKSPSPKPIAAVDAKIVDAQNGREISSISKLHASTMPAPQGQETRSAATPSNALFRKSFRSACSLQGCTKVYSYNGFE